MRTPARSVVILALLKAAAVAQPDSAAACAACTTTVKQLAVAFSREKKELELSKEANDLKAQKIDKVQKAQTKRWLKNEYNVALRASIEEEMEKVCGRDAITSSRALIGACTKLIEEHEDALPRAILDQKHEGFCAKAVPGCDGEARDKAIAAFQHKGKSEKEPKGKASKVRGVVTRLVGTTFSKGIRAPDQHVLVLLHNGSATKERAYEFSDMRYAALASSSTASRSASTRRVARTSSSPLLSSTCSRTKCPRTRRSRTRMARHSCSISSETATSPSRCPNWARRRSRLPESPRCARSSRSFCSRSFLKRKAVPSALCSRSARSG